jgi:hypothetical protein
MSAIKKRLTVDQYDQMVEYGILPETNRFELINGRIVEKEEKDPAHPTVVDLTRRAVERILPAGWYLRDETARVHTDDCRSHSIDLRHLVEIRS